MHGALLVRRSPSGSAFSIALITRSRLPAGPAGLSGGHQSALFQSRDFGLHDFDPVCEIRFVLDHRISFA